MHIIFRGLLLKCQDSCEIEINWGGTLPVRKTCKNEMLF